MKEQRLAYLKEAIGDCVEEEGREPDPELDFILNLTDVADMTDEQFEYLRKRYGRGEHLDAIAL